jgi:hypothetical protein
MKKLVLLLAVVFSVSLFSCGGSQNAQEEAVDSVAVETEEVEVAADSVAADTVAADSVVAVEVAE